MRQLDKADISIGDYSLLDANENLKILHINSYYSKSLFYKNLFDRQVNSGMNVDVYVPVPSNFKKKVDNYGEYTDIRINHGKYDRFIFQLKHRKILNDLQNKYKNFRGVSLTHAHSLFSNGYLSYKIKQKFDIPYVVAVRNTDVNVFLKKMPHLRRLGIDILKNADKIIFLSNSYKTLVLEKYVPAKLLSEISLKTEIIPNGIDDFWLTNASEETRRLCDTVTFIQVGEINKNKNITVTTRALDELNMSGIKVHLKVVGDISDSRIYRQISKYEFVDYLGYLTKEELLSEYRHSDVFILPSKFESFGLVYAEALSQGLPVIYTRNQGFDMQFPDRFIGIAVDSDDHIDVIRGIDFIFKNYIELSKKCSEAAKKFSWDIIESRYKNIYVEIVGGNK